MGNGNYKSLGEVIWRVLKNPLTSEITYEECAEYALEFIRLLGAPVAYIDKTTNPPLELKSHKAELPCDLLYINGVRYINISDENIVGYPIAMREASDIFHISPGEDSLNNRELHRGEATYTIQKGIIFTSECEGLIEIAYKAIATDEEGYPLIPDNEKVMLGIEYYILSRYLEPLWMMGKIPDKAFDYIQQKRYFYMPSAYTSLQMPSIDKMETLMNSLNRLIINTTAHDTSFSRAGVKERIKKFR